MKLGPDTDNVTEQLRRWSERRDQEPDGSLFSLVYKELHDQAQRVTDIHPAVSKTSTYRPIGSPHSDASDIASRGA